MQSERQLSASTSSDTELQQCPMSLQAPVLSAGGGNMQGMTLACPWDPARALHVSAEGELLV